MDNNLKQVLYDIVNGLENLSVALDSLEEALIRRGQLTSGEIETLSPHHVPVVVGQLAALRNAISFLPE